MTTFCGFRRATIGLLGALFAAGALAGCATTEPKPLATLPPIEEYQPSDWDLEQYRSINEHYAETVHLASPPEVDIVRWVNPDAQAGIVAQCLNEAGFPVTLEDQYSYSFQPPEGQADAYYLANYICNAKYPTRGDISRPWTDDEQAAIYRQLVDVYIPCAKSKGYDLDAPSAGVYAEVMKGNTFDPVLEQLDEYNLTDEAFETLQASCQLRPTGLRGYQK